MIADIDCDALDDQTLFNYATWALSTGLWDDRPISSIHLPTLQREIAHNLLELLSWQDPESFAFQQTALRLALIGSDLQNRPCLLNEIEGEKGQFSLLNRRHHKKGFWEKHKVAILVGIGIVALVTTVAIVTLCTGGAGAGAVAATGGSLD